MQRRLVTLTDPEDIEAWKACARALVAAEVPPEAIDWRDGTAMAGDLFAAPADSGEPRAPAADAPPLRIARDLADLISLVLRHSDPARFALAYRLLWRARTLSAIVRFATDPDVAAAEAMARSVRRDMHKMKAFVRFREVTADEGEAHFIAWFEPEHHIVRATAPFFSRRFANMRWSIFTPRQSSHWDGAALSFGAGATRADCPDEDRLEDIWRTYYAATFNPARLRVKAMKAEMPVKYWRNLPEAALIPELVRRAAERTSKMIAAEPRAPRKRRAAADGAPVASVAAASLAEIADGCRQCRRCPLWQHATQAVPGEGPRGARIMLVGEQPGDAEDLSGRPFVGPAGQLLDKALAAAGIDRSATFVTNAVKHFKHEPRGKVRLHKTPAASEIDQCRWWLDAERALVRPQVVVALGTSAVRGITGESRSLGSLAGRPHDLGNGSAMIATVHPSYLLRLRDPEQKTTQWQRLVDDLAHAHEIANGSAAAA